MNLTEKPPIHSGKENNQQSTVTSDVFRGRWAVLATKHGKEAVLDDLFRERLELQLKVPASLDTDLLGTFSGEIPRPYQVRKTLRLKANKGMELTGMDIGIATEGTFGPDPVAPHICAHTETMIVIDRGNDLEITEQLVSHETNYEQLLYKPGGDLESFLERIGFPEHAVIVQPEEPKLFNRLFKEPGTVKGVRDYDLLLTTLEQICRASRTGRAVIETDMRAGMNPTRMKVIRKLGKVMTDRLQRHCPACEVPGWGITFRKQGLPCSGCGMPTQFTLNEIWSCSACGFSDEQPRSDGKQKADPGYCHFCNP